MNSALPTVISVIPVVNTEEAIRANAFTCLFNHIKLYTGKEICDTEAVLLKKLLKYRVLRKRQYLLQEGDVCRYLYYVVDGALRMYSVNSRGQESILALGVENNWIGDRESMAHGIPSNYNIDAIEHTILLQFPVEYIELFIKTMPAFATLIRLQTKEFSIDTQKRIYAVLNLTAEERYRELLATRPEFGQRFSQNLIAAYLGVKPETLSRVRKRY
ncbi:MAG: Crp/Fnr family transcriptional regulator [Mucilaginibacter sp.]